MILLNLTTIVTISDFKKACINKLVMGEGGGGCTVVAQRKLRGSIRASHPAAPGSNHGSTA